MKFDLYPTATINLHTRFDCRRHFSMSRNSVINQRCRIDCRGGVEIGENVSVSEDVIILTGDHDPRSPTMEGRSRKVIIEDFVFIGTRAMILPGVHLGRGAVVAAGAVVTKNVEPFQIVAGVPARCIGLRCEVTDYSSYYRRSFQ